MKSTTFKSIGAVVAGLVVVFALSMLTDFVLQKTGVMIMDPFVDNPVWLIVVIILYRTLFNAFGCYLAARIAPQNPMKHAMILGSIGVVLTIVGLIAMWDIPPRWYPVSLIILTLPAAWLGGKAALNKSHQYS